MIRWFRCRPAPAQQPPLPEGWGDRHFAHAHGIPLADWVKLTPEQQRDLRSGVAAALNERNAAA